MSKTEDKVIIKIELSRGEYEALKAISRREGYNLVSEYVKSVVKKALEERGEKVEGLSVKELSEAIGKRIERIVSDLMNPYTGKIDDISRKISDIITILESISQEKEKTAKTIVREAKKPITAIERLKSQGVVFSEDVQWMKSPEKFFEKLKKEGAIVLEYGGERIAIDSDLWESFREEVQSISIRDVDEASTLIESSLGESAGKLFRKLAKIGLLLYDEDNGVWVLRVQDIGPTSG
ncbi:MAG: hypothetical protein QXD80_00780 [Acidilobaceae archaeon]